MSNGAKTPPVVNRPAIPPPIRVRRSAYSLPATDPIMVFYGRAIDEMRKKPLSDPTSWRYQAAMHDYPRDTPTSDDAPPFARRREEDPFATAAETLPSTSEQLRFWRTCQHFTWFFLPWHRMYIHHFEKMIMGHVARLGGPADWALPYWNYSAGAAGALLPVHFRTPAPGVTNPLFIAQRDPAANAGTTFLAGPQTDLTACLAEPLFPGSGGAGGFGGPITRFNHDTRGAFGVLEAAPHGSIHMGVSGVPRADPSSPANTVRRGFMANFTRAPLDPIFWLHHCNIDRVWKVWLRNPAHANPTTANWLTGQTYSFHDASGAIVDMTSSQVLDTQAAPLSYKYDDDP